MAGQLHDQGAGNPAKASSHEAEGDVGQPCLPRESGDGRGAAGELKRHVHTPIVAARRSDSLESPTPPPSPPFEYSSSSTALLPAYPSPLLGDLASSFVLAAELELASADACPDADAVFLKLKEQPVVRIDALKIWETSFGSQR
eukprot:3657832-Pleurochrysis_carterae.AAC.2